MSMIGSSSHQNQSQRQIQDGNQQQDNNQDSNVGRLDASLNSSHSPSFSSLSQANQLLTNLANQDADWPDLSQHLSQYQRSPGTTPLQYKLQLLSPWNPIEKQRVISLPDQVLESSNSANSAIISGLFPEINRAWIVIDQTLCLWNYLESGTAAIETFQHPSHIIQSVGLVNPKKDVWLDSIKYVLVISTQASVEIVGVSFEPPAEGGSKLQMKLYPVDFSVKSNGLVLYDICGSADGRIFGRGSDQCLREVQYQAKEGWLTNKVTLVNHTNAGLGNYVPMILKSGSSDHPMNYITIDEERGVLYTLHGGNEIEVWHIPTAGPSGPNRISRVKDICRNAATLCPSASAFLHPSEFRIVFLETLSPVESSNIHLVAVTSKGVRLYFSYYRHGVKYGTSSSTDIPQTLDLIHVRPPPTEGLQQTQNIGQAQVRQQQQAQLSSTDFPPYHPEFKGVAAALYSDGIFLASAPAPLVDPSAQQDILLSVSRNPVPRTNPTASTMTQVGNTQRENEQLQLDTATDLIIPGNVIAIAEIKSNELSFTNPKERLNPLARQMIDPSRVFLALTSSGVIVLTEQRPIDALRSLLETSNIFNDSVDHFFQTYGHSQACAMTLAIASRNSQLTTAADSVLVASSGGDLDEGARALDSEVITRAWRVYFEFGGIPKWVASPYPTSQPATAGRVTFSGKHEGLAIYLARLLRPFWNHKLTKKITTKPSPGVAAQEKQEPNLQIRVLIHAQRDLGSLQAFLRQNSQMFGMTEVGGSRGGVSHGGMSEGDQIAIRDEKESFNSLNSLINRTLEAISFMLLLIDSQLPGIVSRCQPKIQTALSNLTFADLTTTEQGRDVARGLVEAIIDAQMAAQVNIDSIAEVLQERCGSFCSAADVRLYKAMECIRRAREAPNEAVRSNALRESHRLLSKATGQMAFDKLENVCKQYKDMRFAQGAIELPLKCAMEWDPQGISRMFNPEEGASVDDPQRKVYESVHGCYRLVLDFLSSLDLTLDEAVRMLGPDSNPSATAEIHRQEIDALRTSAYQQAQLSNDDLFHFALYDWMMERGRSHELLKIDSDFLELYLSMEPHTLEKLDILWQHYVLKEARSSAAVVLRGLAESQDFNLSLQDRAEFLAFAVANAKAHSPSARQSSSLGSIANAPADHVAFTTDLEERLDVARAQVDIQHALSQDRELELDSETRNILVNQLNERLMDINELYHQFVKPYSLFEQTLRILQVSGSFAPELVAETWARLIDKAKAQGSVRDGTDEFAGTDQFARVSAVVADLGKKFMGSENACPVDVLTLMLQDLAYNSQEEGRVPLAGWAPETLLRAGAPVEMVFDVLDEVFESKRAPWDTRTGQAFLLSDISSLLSLSIAQGRVTGGYNSLRSRSTGSNLSQLQAQRVDNAISSYLVALNSLLASPRGDPADQTFPRDRKMETTIAKLRECQNFVKTQF